MLCRVIWYKFTDFSEVLIALVIEAASSSETFLNFYQTTRRNIPDESTYTRRRENITLTQLYSGHPAYHPSQINMIASIWYNSWNCIK
jgi:hypothetical protein